MATSNSGQRTLCADAGRTGLDRLAARVALKARLAAARAADARRVDAVRSLPPGGAVGSGPVPDASGEHYDSWREQL